jgi:hypothetical protein
MVKSMAIASYRDESMRREGLQARCLFSLAERFGFFGGLAPTKKKKEFD